MLGRVDVTPVFQCTLQHVSHRIPEEPLPLRKHTPRNAALQGSGPDLTSE